MVKLIVQFYHKFLYCGNLMFLCWISISREIQEKGFLRDNAYTDEH